MIIEGSLDSLLQPSELPQPIIQRHVWGLPGWSENPLVHRENFCDVHRVGHVYRQYVQQYSLLRVFWVEQGHLFSQRGASVV